MPLFPRHPLGLLLAVWLAAALPGFATGAPAPGAARSYVVDTKSTSAADTNPGSAERPLKTIDAAAKLAGPGDTVLVRAGVYRERVAPLRGGEAGRPIVYRVEPGARVEVKGSEVVSDWRALPEQPGVMAIELGTLIPAGAFNPYLVGVSVGASDAKPVARPVDAAKAGASMARTLGQVFFDGEPMIQATTTDTVREHANTWIVSPDGRRLLAHFPVPAGALGLHVVEVTVRDRIFSPYRRGLSYLEIDGFVFEHCANQGSFPQGGAVSPRSGSHWRFVNNTIRYARTVGLDVGSETWNADSLTQTHPDDRKRIEGGHHVVEHNIISDNGLTGIAGWHHNGVVIRNNLIERNHAADFGDEPDVKWEEWGGIKLHGKGALIEGNLIRDNEAFGIWLDNDVSGSRITRNVILNNRMAGVFVELNAGPVLIDTNIVGYTRPRGVFYDGMGVYAHDADDVTVAHNLVFENAGGGVVMRVVSDRTFAGRPVSSSHARVLNNILWNNSKVAVSLPFENARGTDNVSDYNLLNGLPDYHQGYRPYRQLFGVNVFKNARTADEALAELKEKLAAASIPADQWPPLADWRWHPFLGLEQWRVFTGRDRHSIEPWHGLQAILRPRDLTLSAQIDPAVARMNCPAVDGVTTDFLGRPLTPGRILPGPIQGLGEERRDFVLFPVLPSVRTEGP